MTPQPPPQLGQDPNSGFPDPLQCRHPDGLLAWGGDLKPQRLLNAYRQGIFPWYELGSPILWWFPTPRAVLIPGHVTVSRRLQRTWRQAPFTLTMDVDFAAVMAGCAEQRAGQSGTWITPAMQHAYRQLHELGHAHSVEVWSPDQTLIGGLYGVALGKVFFAESKFHRQRDASKIALLALAQALTAWQFAVIDCQIWNPHLEQFGVRCLSGTEFSAILHHGLKQTDQSGCWTARFRQHLHQAHPHLSAPPTPSHTP